MWGKLCEGTAPFFNGYCMLALDIWCMLAMVFIIV
jgi:hypothetical protein